MHDAPHPEEEKRSDDVTASDRDPDSLTPEDGPITIDEIKNLISDLKAMAYNLLQNEHDAHSVRVTALVISGLRRYKLSDQDWSDVTWNNRGHFFKSAYMMMRRALVDHARRKMAQRRPSIDYKPDDDLYNLPQMLEQTPDRIIDLDESIAWLRESRPQSVAVIEHHYFSGMTAKEIASLLEVSEKTVDRRLAEARTLIKGKMDELARVRSESSQLRDPDDSVR